MNSSYSFSKSYNINQTKEVILVVDDDRNVRFVLKTLFQKHGYVVETSGNYTGLLRLIKELSPNLLITDVKLPDGNVLDNLFKIKDKFWADVNDPESYRKAESEVLKNLNKQQDGIIARYFNRPISLWISKKLSFTNITPNQISIFAFSVACIASLLFAMGSYIPLVIGGILAQISSIIDGCDGEVARLKYQESSYGVTGGHGSRIMLRGNGSNNNTNLGSQDLTKP